MLCFLSGPTKSPKFLVQVPSRARIYPYIAAWLSHLLYYDTFTNYLSLASPSRCHPCLAPSDRCLYSPVRHFVTYLIRLSHQELGYTRVQPRHRYLTLSIRMLISLSLFVRQDYASIQHIYSLPVESPLRNSMSGVMGYCVPQLLMQLFVLELQVGMYCEDLSEALVRCF